MRIDVVTHGSEIVRDFMQCVSVGELLKKDRRERIRRGNYMGFHVTRSIKGSIRHVLIPAALLAWQSSAFSISYFIFPKAKLCQQKRQITYKAMSHSILNTEIGFATTIHTVVSTPRTYTVWVMTQIAVLFFVAFNGCSVTTVLSFSVAAVDTAVDYRVV